MWYYSISSLKDILKNNYYSEELMTGDNKYACETCKLKGRQEAVRKCSLSKLPAVLFLQLMRYVYDFDSGQKKKLMVYIFLNFLLLFVEAGRLP